jgi:hypothetical protein
MSNKAKPLPREYQLQHIGEKTKPKKQSTTTYTI